MQFTKADASLMFARARERNASVFDRLIAMAEVGPSDKCWNTKGNGPGGYAQLRVNGKKQRAHRVMFALMFHDVDSAVVRHKCNNPACINPAHLRAGTPADNAMDRKLSGRGGDLRGTKNGRAVLTEGQAMEIRASALPGSELAVMFGISKAMACRIKRGDAWNHLSKGPQ